MEKKNHFIFQPFRNWITLLHTFLFHWCSIILSLASYFSIFLLLKTTAIEKPKDFCSEKKRGKAGNEVISFLVMELFLRVNNFMYILCVYFIFIFFNYFLPFQYLFSGNLLFLGGIDTDSGGWQRSAPPRRVSILKTSKQLLEIRSKKNYTIYCDK